MLDILGCALVGTVIFGAPPAMAQKHPPNVVFILATLRHIEETMGERGSFAPVGFADRHYLAATAND